PRLPMMRIMRSAFIFLIGKRRILSVRPPSGCAVPLHWFCILPLSCLYSCFAYSPRKKVSTVVFRLLQSFHSEEAQDVHAGAGHTRGPFSDDEYGAVQLDLFRVERMDFESSRAYIRHRGNSVPRVSALSQFVLSY